MKQATIPTMQMMAQTTIQHEQKLLSIPQSQAPRPYGCCAMTTAWGPGWAYTGCTCCCCWYDMETTRWRGTQQRVATWLSIYTPASSWLIPHNLATSNDLYKKNLQQFIHNSIYNFSSITPAHPSPLCRLSLIRLLADLSLFHLQYVQLPCFLSPSHGHSNLFAISSETTSWTWQQLGTASCDGTLNDLA